MIRTMLRLRARPGCEPAVGPAFETVAGQLGALAGNLRHELLRDALDPRGFVVVTEWADEAALRAYRRGPVAARLAGLLQPLTEPADGPGYPLLRETGDGEGPVYVDVELTVPRDRLAEFHRGYPEVVRRMSAIPGYRREQLLREPGSDIHHIFAEWDGAAPFLAWISDPAHASAQAGPIAPFLLDIRRRLFHVVPDADGSSHPTTGWEADVHRTTDVLVVGAGPTGLTAAVELARRGIDCLVIDKQATPPGHADKAIGVHCRTMEIWEEQGVVREAMDAGIWLTGNMVFVNGAQTHRMSWELPGLPYAHLGLPQYETERILTDRLAALGVRPRRGAELADLTQDADGVTATVRTADGGTETVRARYVVGADGAHSRVRERLGLTFTGGLGRFPQLFMLVDVDVDWDMPDGHLLRFLHMTDGQMDGMLVCVPLRGEHRYRIATLAPPRFFAQTGGRDAPPGFSEELDEPHHRRRAGRAGPPRATRHPGEQPALVVGVPDQPRHRRPLPRRPDLRRRGRRPPAPAGRRPGHEHRHPGRLEPGLETRARGTRARRARAAGQLRDRAAAGGRGDRRPGGTDGRHRGGGPRRPGTAVPPGDVHAAQLRRAARWSGRPSPTRPRSATRPAPATSRADVDGLRRRGVGHPLRLRDLTRGTRHTLLLYADGTAGAEELAAFTGLCADARAARRRGTRRVPAARPGRRRAAPARPAGGARRRAPVPRRIRPGPAPACT